MMRKLIFSFFVVLAFSSASYASKPLTTAEDSLAYSLGISVGSYWIAQDSTMNSDLICQGIKEVFSKKAGVMTDEDAQQFIQTYMSEVKPRKDSIASAEFLAKMVLESGIEKSESGLLYRIENQGSGEKPEIGDSLFVNFTLYDINGNKIQSSDDSGAPIAFVNQDNMMIEGFLEGVRMLSTGGKATLYIPSEIGYGRSGYLANKALVFYVELVRISAPVEPQYNYEEESQEYIYEKPKSKKKRGRR